MERSLITGKGEARGGGWIKNSKSQEQNVPPPPQDRVKLFMPPFKDTGLVHR